MVSKSHIHDRKYTPETRRIKRLRRKVRPLLCAFRRERRNENSHGHRFKRSELRKPFRRQKLSIRRSNALILSVSYLLLELPKLLRERTPGCCCC